jgi:hypothetical protein
MRKVGLLVVVAMGMLAFSGGANAFAQGTTMQNTTLTVTMNAQNDSGESGTATLSEQNGQLVVTVNLQNGTSAPQPAHIHKGTCASLDPAPFIPLTSVVNGQATTTIDLGTNATVKSLADLTSGQYAINVHKSAAEVKTYVSCGDIVNMQMGGGGTSTGGSTAEPTAAPTSGGAGGTVGMPTTGGGEQNLPLMAALILVAVALLGAGLTLSRRRA